jgi:DNA-binding protein HU-beta
VAKLSESHDLPKKLAEAVLGDLVALATRHLKNGDKICLTGLGILQVQQRDTLLGRNPATGETIEIKASKKLAFTDVMKSRGESITVGIRAPTRVMVTGFVS